MCRFSKQKKRWSSTDWNAFWDWYQRQCVCFLGKSQAKYHTPKTISRQRRPLVELLARAEALAIPKRVIQLPEQPKFDIVPLKTFAERPWIQSLNKYLAVQYQEGVRKRKQIDRARCILRNKITTFRDRHDTQTDSAGGRVEGVGLNQVLSSLFPCEPSPRIQKLARHKVWPAILDRLDRKIKCQQRYIDTVRRWDAELSGTGKHKKLLQTFNQTASFQLKIF